jgi:hypothetical protein
MDAVIVLLVGLAGVAALYGVHHLALWLEGRRLLYYRHAKPTGGGFAYLSELQKAVEPQAEHIIRVNEEGHRPARQADGTAPGPDEAG